MSLVAIASRIQSPGRERYDGKIGFMGGIKYVTPKITLVIVVIVVLLSFIVLVTR